MSSLCYMCKEDSSTWYKFIKDKSTNIHSNSKDNSSYCHKICPECLIQYIFIKDLKIFEKTTNDYEFVCPFCSGKLILTYEQLIDVFQNKIFDNLQKKKEKNCKKHNKNNKNNKKEQKELFCKDCNIDICSGCYKENKDEHSKHKIEDRSILLQKYKKFFELLNLKFKNFKDFMENFNKICKKFKEIFEKNYNNILSSIDEIINDLIDLRANYSVFYKEKVVSNVQTLKILKLFYSNFYYDVKKAENDIKIYKYINQINFEIDDIIPVEKKEHLKKLDEIKINVKFLKDNYNEIFDINYKFQKIPDGYRKYHSISRCDEKLIKSIFKIDEERIITFGNSINLMEAKKGGFEINKGVKVLKNFAKDTITSFLMFKNGNILTAHGKNKNFNIYEWIKNSQNDDRFGVKFINYIDEDCYSNSNKMDIGRVNTFELNKRTISCSSLPVNNNALYKLENSFLSPYKDNINSMIEIDENTFVSVVKEKIIIIWKKNKQSKKFEIFQTITAKTPNSHKEPIQLLLCLYNKSFISCDINTIKIWGIVDNQDNQKQLYDIQQTIKFNNDNKDALTSIFQIRDGDLISGSKNSIIEIWKEIDNKYTSVQNINLNINSITCINQLKDDRIIICSNKGYIRILIKINDMYKINESIDTIHGMPISCIACFDDDSFIIGQNTTLHVWRNYKSF